MFYAFNLEGHIPGDHMLRGIDRFMDLSELRQHLASFYSHTGRPSIDHELMIRVLVIGYCFGIRSERRLCEEVHLNLVYRWFCRLGLEDLLEEPSRTIPLERCIPPRLRIGAAALHVRGLVGGEGFAIDASVICKPRQRCACRPRT